MTDSEIVERLRELAHDIRNGGSPGVGAMLMTIAGAVGEGPAQIKSLAGLMESWTVQRIAELERN